MNLLDPLRDFWTSPYRSSSAHFLRRAGSLCARFAFCAKEVLGRLTVFLRSSGVSVLIISKSNSNSRRRCYQNARLSSFNSASEPSTMYSSAQSQPSALVGYGFAARCEATALPRRNVSPLFWAGPLVPALPQIDFCGDE